MRAMSLDSYDKVEEDNELHNIKQRLESTNNLVANLSKQIEELKDIVNSLLSLLIMMVSNHILMKTLLTIKVADKKKNGERLNFRTINEGHLHRD